MLASYALSRTLTPITIGLLLKGEHHGAEARRAGFFARLHAGFERGFERMRDGYSDAADRRCCAAALIVPIAAVAGADARRRHVHAMSGATSFR